MLLRFIILHVEQLEVDVKKKFLFVKILETLFNIYDLFYQKNIKNSLKNSIKSYVKYEVVEKYLNLNYKLQIYFNC